jgi:hypothetical protein
VLFVKLGLWLVESYKVRISLTQLYHFTISVCRVRESE